MLRVGFAALEHCVETVVPRVYQFVGQVAGFSDLFPQFRQLSGSEFGVLYGFGELLGADAVAGRPEVLVLFVHGRLLLSLTAVCQHGAAQVEFLRVGLVSGSWLPGT